MAVFDDIGDNKLLLYPHKIEWLNRIPVAAKAEAELVKLEMDEPLKAECEHFIDCVTNKKQPIIDGREGLRVLQVLQALQRSLNKKSRKVTIDQDALSLLKRKEFNSSGVSLGYENQENPFFIHESAYVDEGVNIVQVLRYGIFHISCPALRLVSNAA